MLRTMSRIKRVCAMILVPRLFRGSGCSPGKFYRLKFDVIRKVKKSTSSGRTDRNKPEDVKCKKCKKIIEYAFGPAEPYLETDKGGKDLGHVSMCTKTQGPEDERLTHAKDNKVIAEWLQLNAQSTKDNNNATLLEDLKGKSLSDARANVLLRVRNLDTILATVENKEKEIIANAAEGKDDDVVIQANAGKGKEEIKPHDVNAVTKGRLESTDSVTEATDLKLNATAASKPEDEKMKLATKIESITEVPLVEAAPRADIFNPMKCSILNVTRFEKPPLDEIQAQVFDNIAQKYMQSPMKEIDRHLTKDISQLNIFPSPKMFNTSAQEKKLEPEVVKKEPLDTELNAVNTPEKRTELVNNSEHISSELKIEPMRPAEAEIKIEPNPAVQKLVAKVHLSADKENPGHEKLYFEFLRPAYDGRVALRDVGERSIEEPEVDDIKSGDSQCEHKQPCHLFKRNLVDVVHTTEPKNGLLVREYPYPRKAVFEPPKYITDPADKRTFDSEEQELQNTSTALHDADVTEYAIVGAEKKDHVQPPASSVLPDKRQSIINSEVLSKDKVPTASHNWQCNQEGIVNPKEEDPTRAAVEMANTFIQAQPCAEPIHVREQKRKESAPNPYSVDEPLPEIDLNDPNVSLTELLRRVRERNRILYVREVAREMAIHKSAINPTGKCGDKKPQCPPPEKKCPPPPPPCPPTPPKCPSPCAPPKKSKPRAAPCPPPTKCAPKKDPCAKFKAHETITLVLHLGPLVNPGRKFLIPVLVTNFLPPAPYSEDRLAKGFLANWINQNHLLLREILGHIFKGWPAQTCDALLLRLNRTRDYTPCNPIPSWPYPIISRKKRLQCPKEGCPVNPPVNPAPRFQLPCPNKPCTNFPKRPA